MARKDCLRKKKEVVEVANELGLRYKSILHLKETGNFDGSEFYGFCGDVEENKDRQKLNIGD